MEILLYDNNGLSKHPSAVLAIILRPDLLCEGKNERGRYGHVH